MESTKSRRVALLLCLLFGALGVHRFYVGRWHGAVVMLVIFIGFGWLAGLGFIVAGVWALVDFIMICAGKFRDSEGLRLANW